MAKAVIVVALLLMLIFPVSAAADDYKLSAGDVITISVFGFPELELKEITVRPDGKIAYPLLGEIKVDGLTPTALTDRLTDYLGEYYVNPHVTVNVIRARTTQVCVLGEVTRPGVYELGKNHTLLDAISAASGWTRDAAKSSVYIVRRNQKGEPLKVNLVALLKKGDMSKNYVINEGDIVFLGENKKIDVGRDILPFVYPAYLIHHWEKEPS